MIQVLIHFFRSYDERVQFEGEPGERLRRRVKIE